MDERPKVALVALGCRVNRSDLDALASAIGESFCLAARGEQADYVVVNTCTVTADADAAVRQAIRRAARDHPGARIVAAGCYAEVRPEELRSLPNVVAVVGARSRLSVREVLLDLRGRGTDAAREGAVRAPASLPPPVARQRGQESKGPPGGSGGSDLGPPPLRPFNHTRAFLKVQDGCDARCAYCVVPRARGGSRSLGLEEALERIAALGRVSPEVVLAGVHLGAYGRDRKPASSLAQLVAVAAERRLARRIRLSSIEPQELPVELFRSAARPVLCEHVHLPLQSGSPLILAAMNRPYSPSEYASSVERFAAVMPEACVGADVMTGFPGETDVDHRQTMALVEKLPLSYLHVFPFSARPGTAAAAMPGQVASAVARERARELSAFSARRWRAFAAAQRGRELEVVVERVGGGFAAGTARRYVAVRWPWSGERRGDLVRVRVEAAVGDECLGVRAPAVAQQFPG